MNNLVYLLDVSTPNQGYRSKLHLKQSKLAIGIGMPGRLAHEEQKMYQEAQECLASQHTISIVAQDLRRDLILQATDGNWAEMSLSAGLEKAMADYLEGVSGPIRTLRDIVNWHSTLRTP